MKLHKQYSITFGCVQNPASRATGHLRIATSLAVCILIFIASAANLFADDSPPSPREKQIADVLASLKYRGGEIKIKDGLATLNLPTNLTYLDSRDSESVLVKLWGNPPDNGKILGMILPTGISPTNEDTWAVTITYDEGGFVKDDEAAKINYDDLLAKLKTETAEASKERVKRGFPSVALIGWATPPRYDAQTHKLYWARELQFGGAPTHTLNYFIRILGRHGVLELNAIGGIEQLPEIEKQIPTILSAVNFNEGSRYSDFDPKIDKVATYGIAALIAGGVAAKLGFFKLLLVGLLAAKKFIIIGFIAIASFLKKFFGGRKPQTPPLPSTPSNFPPAPPAS